MQAHRLMPAETIRYGPIRTGPERPQGVPDSVAELYVQTRILLGILRRRYLQESEDEKNATARDARPRP